MELSNGDRYVGEWSLDQMHGQGKYVSSGGEYEGGWVKGLREGKVSTVAGGGADARSDMLTTRACLLCC